MVEKEIVKTEVTHYPNVVGDGPKVRKESIFGPEQTELTSVKGCGNNSWVESVNDGGEIVHFPGTNQAEECERLMRGPGLEVNFVEQEGVCLDCGSGRGVIVKI